MTAGEVEFELVAVGDGYVLFLSPFGSYLDMRLEQWFALGRPKSLQAVLKGVVPSLDWGR